VIIEIHLKENKVEYVGVVLPAGNSYQSYKLRKEIIETELFKVRRIYPFADLYLVFESRMNKTKSSI
jgi:hypothetical protein